MEYATIQIRPPSIVHHDIQNSGPLHPEVSITDNGFVIKVRGKTSNPEGEKALKATTIPATSIDGKMEHDYKPLTEMMRQIKNEHRDESEITIDAEEKVPLQIIVNVMDAVREDGMDKLFPDVIFPGSFK